MQRGAHTCAIGTATQHLGHLYVLDNLDGDRKQLMSMVLVGLTELRHRLDSPKHRSLYPRLDYRVHLANPSAEDSVEYVQCRLAQVGAAPLLLARTQSLCGTKLRGGDYDTSAALQLRHYSSRRAGSCPSSTELFSYPASLHQYIGIDWSLPTVEFFVVARKLQLLAVGAVNS